MSWLQVTLLQQVNLDYLDENQLGKVVALFETMHSKLSGVCVSCLQVNLPLQVNLDYLHKKWLGKIVV